MIVPHSQLQPATLRAIVLEFVTRDGTDHTDIDIRTEQVLAQLELQHAELDFDDLSQSCNIVLKPHL